MIALSLNFKNEEKFPINLDEFNFIISKYEFQFGFKTSGNKIIPLSSYNSDEKLTNNKKAFSFTDTSKLYAKISNSITKDFFYVLNRNGIYYLYIDDTLDNPENINKTIIATNGYKKIVNLIVSKIYGNKVEDPYIIHIIQKYLENTLGYKDRIVDIINIRETSDIIKIKYNRYFEKNGGNPEDPDFYNYGGAMNTYKEVIKKDDLMDIQ